MESAAPSAQPRKKPRGGVDPAADRGAGDARDLTPGDAAGRRRNGEGSRFIQELIPQMRDWIFQDLGVFFPGVKVRGDAPYLEPNTYMIYVNEVPTASGTVHPGQIFVADNLEQLAMLGIEGTPGQHPDGESARDVGRRRRTSKNLSGSGVVRPTSTSPCTSPTSCGATSTTCSASRTFRTSSI
jgi:hypothetical protein